MLLTFYSSPTSESADGPLGDAFQRRSFSAVPLSRPGCSAVALAWEALYALYQRSHSVSVFESELGWCEWGKTAYCVSFWHSMEWTFEQRGGCESVLKL